MLHHMNVAAMALADGRTAVGSRGRMLVGRVDLLRLFRSSGVSHSIFAGHEVEPQEVQRKYDGQNFHGTKIAFLRGKGKLIRVQRRPAIRNAVKLL